VKQMITSLKKKNIKKLFVDLNEINFTSFL